MKKGVTSKIATLFLGIVLFSVAAPITVIGNSIELKTAFAAVPSCSGYGGLNPITDFSKLPPGAPPPPPGATYYCLQLMNGNSLKYSFLDADNKLINSLNTPGIINTGLTDNSYRLDANGNLIETIKTPLVCTASWTNLSAFFNPICWMRMLGALITSIFISLGTTILEIAGYLFNFLLDYTVVQFSTLIYAKIKSAVEIGWTAFRDIANILIIGMFTFIAISIILGEKTFGQKRLIAKVLIIAVLINFSLLFTKMIIDASNFTASQFYNAALGQVANTAGPNVNVTLTAADAASNSPAVQANSSSKGISGQFMEAIGITGFADAYSYVRKEQEKSNDGLIGMAFGILSLIYLLGAAIVLFYGCFLLVSRAILLIFLMITSSLAFASYLIPAWETSSYGWKTWWNSLLKSAVFAPMLMLFLWITLMIAKALAVNGPTIGKLGVDPKANVAAAFSYLMILGLLFLSFKLSSSFAGKIAGFNWAAAIPAMAGGWGMRLAGIPLKYGIGSRAANKVDSLEKQAKEAGRAGDMAKARRLNFQASLYKPFAKSDYNLANTRVGKTLADTAGIKGAIAGQSKGGGYDKYSEGQAKYAADLAGKIEYSKEDKEKVRREALNAAEGVFAPDRNEIKEKRRLAREEVKQRQEKKKDDAENFKQQRELQEQNMKTIQEQRRQSADDFKGQQEALSKERTQLEEVRKNAMADQAVGRDGADDRLADATKRLGDVIERKSTLDKRSQIELKAQDDSIEHIATNLKTIKETEQQTLQQHDADIQSAEENHKRVKTQADTEEAELNKRVVEEAEKRVPKAVNMTRQQIAAQLANQRFTNVLAKAVGLGHEPETDIVAARAGKVGKQKSKTEDLEALLKDMRSEEKGAETETPKETGGDKH